MPPLRAIIMLPALFAVVIALLAASAHAQPSLTVAEPVCPVLDPPQPVCGSTGRSFRSACVAQKAGVFKYNLCGSCPVKNAKICKGLSFKPYCCDGFTYYNLCSAKTAGVANKQCKKGICPDGPIMCALCVARPNGILNGCQDPKDTNPCKGKPGLKCQFSTCSSNIVTDTGKVIQTPLCAPYYVNAAGLAVTRCLPKN